uniref:Fungal lipase-type domain-containing protein n=1 Tax=Oryza barthii TaxID=65489 RepID=A0A0D3HKT6_9ORYZ
MAIHLTNPPPGLYAAKTPSQQQQQHRPAGSHAAAAAAATVAMPQTASAASSSVAVKKNMRQAAPVVVARRRTTAVESGGVALASVWREVQGERDWEGMVEGTAEEELHPLLRGEIVRYGELVAATYKAFDLDAASKRYLNCKYGKARMLDEVGMAGAGYTVTRYIYATANADVHGKLLSEVTRLIAKHKHEDVSVTLAGHSMGSSLALLLGYDLAELGLNRDARGRAVPITVFSFAGPRVGNTAFKDRCDELGVKVLRVVNVNDPITKLPGIFLNENSRVLGGKLELPWSSSCYTHVGVELALDFFKARDPACVHDLEAYLGLLKCPKVTKVMKEGEDLFSKAKKIVLEQSFDTWRWQMAAIQVGGLVQALGM